MDICQQLMASGDLGQNGQAAHKPATLAPSRGHDRVIILPPVMEATLVPVPLLPMPHALKHTVLVSITLYFYAPIFYAHRQVSHHD